MSIRIEHSVAGNCIVLHGAERPSYPNTTVSAIPDSTVTNTVNILNTITTESSGSDKYELFQIPFTDFVDVSGGSFTDVSSCVEYINVAANDMSRADTWEHFVYNSITGRIQADKPFETTLNSLYLGDQHKMSSGSENIYFTNLTTDVNWYPAWGGIKDQSLSANQDMSGVYNPTGRVFGAYGVLALGGNPVTGTSIAYDGDNYFPANISGMGITTVVAETVASNVLLRYELSVDGTPVYQQFLEHNGLSVDQPLSWTFDHPLDVNGGSTNHASITKVAADGTDIGLLLVCEGDDGTNRYQTTVANRSYEDKNIAFTEDLDNLDVVGFYDIYVDPTFAGTGEGTNLAPYTTILEAVNASSAGDKIFVKGVNNVTSEIVLSHSLSFYGIDGSEIRYATYDAANGNILKFTGSANTQSFTFKNIAFSNAGEYALKIVQAAYLNITDCTFTHNGWNGTGLNTVLDSSATGIAGYDSSASTLQAFYAGANASNGGAMRIENITNIRVIGNVALENLRGLRIQDCGIGGSGFITRNVATKNIESGIYIAAGSLLGSQNITTTMNVTSYNANNGLLCIGGINNKFSQNEVNGNWNAGFCAWGSANATLRDCGLYDNNRSEYNGIGNTGDAKASIQINEAYNLLGTTITLNSDARFISEILDTQVHYTGLGSSTEKIGFLITSGVGSLSDDDKNIIKVDDVGFIGQDYAIDFSEVDLTNLRVALGDNSYMTIGESAVKAPLLGNYNELPFSNHVMEVPEVDVVVDTLKQTISLREGVGGNVINVYGVNELQSVLKTNSVDIIQKASDKIQLRDCTLGNVYINGVVAGSNLVTLNDSLNGAFNMDLIEYKQFLESEIGVSSSGTTTPTTAAFYYIESPDTEFHYPLFKDESEANDFDTANGGSGSSSQHTYVDDLGGITWYKPTTLGVTSASAAPVHGVYGTSENVVWNIQNTDVDSNYVPTFTDITYTIQEQSAVNIVYKPAGDTDTYNVTNIPTGYADTGYAIVGTAETITNGVDVSYTLNVTKANAFGSDTGTISLTITDDPTNNVASNDTPWTKALDFTGGNEYTKQVSSSMYYQPIQMQGLANQVGMGTSPQGDTSNSSSSRPWATAVVFKSDGSNSNQIIWNQGEGSSTNNDNIYLRLTSVGSLMFGWGREGAGYNECRFANQNISSSNWYGVYIAHSGERLGGNNASAANLADCFDIRLMSSADSFASVGNNLSTTSNWITTGNRMDRTFAGDFTVGGRSSNLNFYGKVASCLVTTFRQAQTLPTTNEVDKMITDPVKWYANFKSGENFRLPTSGSTSSWGSNSSNAYKATQIWLMGDGTSDSYSNGIRNYIYPADQNWTKMQFTNMQSNDIENVTIPGLT